MIIRCFEICANTNFRMETQKKGCGCMQKRMLCWMLAASLATAAKNQPFMVQMFHNHIHKTYYKFVYNQNNVLLKTMKTSQTTNSMAIPSKGTRLRGRRDFTMKDIPFLTSKIFSQFDKDKNNRFTKEEFSTVIKTLIQLVGGDNPHIDDIEDIFNLLDVNGDETIDRCEFESIMTVFFKLLSEKQIDVAVEKESDLLL